MKNKFKSFIIPCIVTIVASSFSAIFLYLQNVSEVNFQEAYMPILFCSIIGGIIYTVVYFSIHKPNKSVILSFIFINILLNYAILEKGILLLFGNLKYWHILPILLVIAVHIAYLINKKINEAIAEIIVTASGVALMALLLFNSFIAGPQMVKKLNSQIDMSDYSWVENIDKVGNSNFYYMIFDEYANFSIIKQYYNYSNEEFMEYLRSKNFTISLKSSNESGNTVSVLTNCLNIDYVVSSAMDALEIQKYREAPLLFTIFKDQGYSLKGVGDTNWLNLESANAQTNQEGQTIEGFNFSQVVLNNTFLYPFFTYSGTQAAKLILNTFDYMQTPSNIKPDNSEFVLLYLNSPHQPFLFDSEGNAVDPQNYNNWSDDKYYLDQYIFITTQIQKTVNTIIENDPNAVILLSSDHGPRFKKEIAAEDKLRILNAVYYKGNDIEEINGHSTVNTLRTIINKLFDLNYPVVEVSDSEK